MEDGFPTPWKPFGGITAVSIFSVSDPVRAIKPINAVSPCLAFYVKAFIHLVTPVPEQRFLATERATQ